MEERRINGVRVKNLIKPGNAKNIIIFGLILLSIISIFILPVVTASDKNIDMNFKDADLKDVFRSIARLADINLIVDNSVEGTITLELKDVSYNKALSLITKTQNLEYKQEDDNTIIIATPERMEEIYEKEVTEIINIKYSDPEKLRDIIQNISSEINVEIDNQKSNLILNGTSDRIENAKTIIDRLDEKVAQETKIVNIDQRNLEQIHQNLTEIYTDLIIEINSENNSIILSGPEEIVKKAEDLANQLDTDIEQNEKTRVVSISGSNVNNIKENLEQIYSDLKIQVDEDSNNIIINGNEEKLTEVVSLIEKLEVPEEKIQQVIELKQDNPDRVIENIQSFYPEVELKKGNSNNVFMITGDEEEVNEITEYVEKVESNEEEMDEENITEMASVDYIELEQAREITENVLPGVDIQIEERNNNFIITGKRGQVEQALNLVERIDNPRRQVLIEARVEEISRNKVSDLGIDQSQLENLSEIEFINEEEGFEVEWPSILEAMEEEGAASTLANPRLMTVNGEEASLLIGDQIPYPVTEEDEEGESTTNYEYRDVGINLRFTPEITEEDLIGLEVNPEVSDLGEDSYGDTPLPPLRTREAETEILLEDGQSFAIGGLIQDRITEDISKIPLISDIPILGKLFQHRSETEEETEVVIFITPHIVDSNQEKEDNIDSEEADKDSDDKVKEDKEQNITEKDIKEENLADEAEVSEKNIGSENTNNENSISGLNEIELEYLLYQNRLDRGYYDLPESKTIEYITENDFSSTKVADRFGINEENIISKKEKSNNKTLFEIEIPRDHLFRLQKNETLKEVGDRFGLNLDILEEINKYDKNKELEEGTIIILPFDKED